MTKHPTPDSNNGNDDILNRLDALTLNADDDESYESVTPNPNSNLQGEYEGGNISPTVSLPDCEEDLQRSGGGNLVPIIGFVDDNKPSLYCLGFVGSNKNSFCTKRASECNVDLHKQSENKFKPKEFHYYINRFKSGTTAWCQPCQTEVALHSIPHSETSLLAPGIQKTLTEWKAIFDAAKSLNHTVDTEDDVKQHISNFTKPLDYSIFKTPAKAAQELTGRGLDDDDDNLFKVNDDIKMAMTYVKEENSSKFLSADEGKTAMENLLITVTFLLESYDSLAKQIQSKATLNDVAKDINHVTTSIAGLKSDVGSNVDSPFPDLWTAVSELSTLTTLESWDKIVATVKLLQEQMVMVEGHQQISNQRWQKLADDWIPALLRHDKMVNKMSKYYIKMASKPTRAVPLSHLDTVLDRGVSHVDFETSSVSSHSKKVEAKVDRCSSNINTLLTRLDRLEELCAQRDGDDSTHWDSNGRRYDRDDLKMTGVTYRHYHFRDINHLKECMKKEMSQPCHGLFVDGVSFMEFLGGDRYVECNTTLNDLYLTSKVGFAAQSDAIVAASFQNILPAALGRRPDTDKGTANSAEMEAQAELSGIRHFSDWDARDGSTGRKYWVKKESRGAYRNLDGMQRHQLNGTGIFKSLAHDTLIDSKEWVDLVMNFISTSFEDTMHSGRFDEAQAWRMTCKFVKRIFSELADARVIARHGIDIEDKWTTSARFIFGTLKAHEIMEEYSRLSIKDHPSISSEMVKFICYSQPSTDTAEVMTRLGNLETLQRGDQSAIARLDTRVKRVETWKNESDKTIKKLVDKHGI